VFWLVTLVSMIIWFLEPLEVIICNDGLYLSTCVINMHFMCMVFCGPGMEMYVCVGKAVKCLVIHFHYYAKRNVLDMADLFVFFDFHQYCFLLMMTC